MRNFKIPAIIFGGDAINALGVIRNLGSNGVDVYYVTDKKNEASFSKYCKKSFIIPGVDEDIDKTKMFFAQFEKEICGSAVVFPGSDMACLNLSSLRSEVDESFLFVLPEEEIVQTLVNKKKFYYSLKKHNIPHPTTYFIKSLEDLDEIDKETSYPLFIRPSISQIFTKKFRKKGFVVKSKEDLKKYCYIAMRNGIEIMIQEIIPGPASNMFCIDAYFDQGGNPKGLFAYRRIREWPLGFGNGSLIESIPLSMVYLTKDIMVRYFSTLGFHGLIDAEFKRDVRDGCFKFLEVNPRTWWQNSFPTKCGVNLIFIAYLDAIGCKINFEKNYKEHLKWIYFLNDVRSVMKLFKRKEVTIRKWLSSLHLIKDYAFFSADDLIPFISNLLFTMQKITKRKILS